MKQQDGLLRGLVRRALQASLDSGDPSLEQHLVSHLPASLNIYSSRSVVVTCERPTTSANHHTFPQTLLISKHVTQNININRKFR